MLDGTDAIWLAGCGNMAGAMLHRWLAAGLDPARVLAIRPSGAPVADGVAVVKAPPRGVEPPALLMLGFKPQMLAGAAPAYAALVGPGTVVVSILAGIDLAELKRRLPGAGGYVRAMPNLPVALGKGVVSLCAEADGETRTRVEALMAPLGLVEPVPDEALFDAYTALAGCGTGFLLRFVAALEEGATALGLAPEVAARLALATVEGGALWTAAEGEAPAVLAARVASKGGSTQAGYDVLDRDAALVRLMTETLEAAQRRNAELGAAARTAAADGAGA